ncbi:Na+/H+ antiporter subunit E [Dehalococcoidia bacterium]|nr:Na+/H+ antiporter subunit E [Dehalococcoidia bacterium]
MTKLKNASGFWLTFILLFGFWLLLSGRMDIMHLGLGLVCSLLVALFSHNLLVKEPEGILRPLVIFSKFIPFLGWLVLQIIIANIDVARRVIDPKMPILPGIIKFKSNLKSDVAQTTLATSITLTPGTMTVDVVGGDFYIHCLAIEDEEKVVDNEREFERQVERLFGDRDADHRP